MTCNYCPKTALYRVGTLGYCKDHRGQAVALRTSINIKRQETQDVFFDHIVDEKERRLRAVRRMQNASIAARKRRK